MLRVVLADDENKVILLMQKLIDWEALGYEIAGTANDELRALELVREKQPHLLITDVRMPGCDGIELIQRAKALQPKLHFIVISGYRKFEYAQNALKYGVEDYLLKPLKQEELTGILLRLKEKMGQEAALEFQLKRSGEHQQELLLDALLGTAERGTSFLSAGQANGEYGFHFGSGTYAAAVIRVDVPDAESYQDGYRILLRHALEIVRRESGLLTEEFAASLGHAGIAVLLYLRAYHAVEVTQCFTKIRKEIENQRDLFWNVQATVCLGSRRDSLEQVGESMREALWLCRDRLCRPQSWRDAALEMPDLARRYQMDASRKKSFQVAAECLDEVRFVQELEESCRTVEALPDLNGQMVEDWFRQVLEACLYGMRQSGETEAPLEEEMDKRFWHCTAWGLFVGCAIANLLSAAGIFDVVFGSLATLLAALCTAWLGRGRGAQSWLRCVLAALMPVVFNFVFVGAVLTWSLTDAVFPHLNASFWLFGGQVALGEVAVLGILGLPLMRLLPRNPKFREIICSYQKE